MKIVVLGASRGVGRYVVEQALDADFSVTALLRNTAQEYLAHPNLTIQSADARDLLSLQRVLPGHEAIVSTLGPSGLGKADLYSVTTKNLISAMGRTGIRRIISVSAIGADPDPDLPLHLRWLTRLIVRPILNNLWTDAARMEKIWAASDLDWTVIRPPRLTHGPLTKQYRTIINARLHHPIKLSRADLADCILKEITNRAAFGARIEVAR
jgi:putative NADH-flavin reductase